MSAFDRARQRLHASVLSRLSDGPATYLARTGEVLAEDIKVILDREVERTDRVDSVTGLFERTTTLTVRKGPLQRFDRQGAFVLDGKTWHIDGIASDDGHLITLYVVP